MNNVSREYCLASFQFSIIHTFVSLLFAISLWLRCVDWRERWMYLVFLILLPVFCRSADVLIFFHDPRFSLREKCIESILNGDLYWKNIMLGVIFLGIERIKPWCSTYLITVANYFLEPLYGTATPFWCSLVVLNGGVNLNKSANFGLIKSHLLIIEIIIK